MNCNSKSRSTAIYINLHFKLKSILKKMKTMIYLSMRKNEIITSTLHQKQQETSQAFFFILATCVDLLHYSLLSGQSENNQ